MDPGSNLSLAPLSWGGFREVALDLADAGEGLFEKSGMLMIGTIRKDGSPRISPVEPLITGGELYLGMMGRSLKAQDLRRDPRCIIHNAIRDRNASDGEFKAHGRAREVVEAGERSRYGEALKQKIGWSPEGVEFHLFSFMIQTAGLFLTHGDARILKLWKAGGPVRIFRQQIDGRLDLEG